MEGTVPAVAPPRSHFLCLLCCCLPGGEGSGAEPPQEPAPGEAAVEAMLLLPQVCPILSRPIPMHGTRAGGQQERVPALPPQGRVLHQRFFYL